MAFHLKFRARPSCEYVDPAKRDTPGEGRCFNAAEFEEVPDTRFRTPEGQLVAFKARALTYFAGLGWLIDEGSGTTLCPDHNRPEVPTRPGLSTCPRRSTPGTPRSSRTPTGSSPGTPSGGTTSRRGSSATGSSRGT